MKSPCPVEVEDGGEIVRVSVEEELRRLPRGELIAQREDRPHTPRSHQFSQPSESRAESEIECHSNLVAGNFPSNSLSQRNLSPPTSRMTILLLLSELASLLLEFERWSWNEEFIITDPGTSLGNNKLTIKH